MPSFNPTGFTYSRSLTASQPFANGLQTFLWNPALHGFAGDACCNMLYAGVSQTPVEPTPLVETGYVYPVPITILPTYPTGGPTIVIPAAIFVVGVVSSFKYYPASLSKGEYIVSPTYPANTTLQQNTNVEVQVVVDPNAIYSIQVKGSNGLITNQVAFQFGVISADYNADPNLSNVYTATLPNPRNNTNNTFLFPYGVLDGNGAFPGSRCYLLDATTLAPSVATNTIQTTTTGTSTTVLISPTLGVEGNGLSAQTPGINPTAIAPLIPNPIVDVNLATQFFYANYSLSYFGAPNI